MSIETKAKRILAALDSYHPVLDGSCPIPQLRTQLGLHGAKPLGIYWNTPNCFEAAVLVSDLGLVWLLNNDVVFVDYGSVQRVDIIAHGSIVDGANGPSKNEADGILLNVDGPNPISVPVRNGHGRYRDAFEFSRFVSRAAEASRHSLKTLDHLEERARLMRHAG